MRKGKENARPDGRTSEQAAEGWSETVSYHSNSSAQCAVVEPYDCFLPSTNSTRNGGGGQDIFAAVKERVSLPEAAAFYGYAPNRSGFICCPFHGEKTPSCRLWDDHFYCFGCKTGGSVIDFAVRLFNLSPLDAVRRLNTDFNLGLRLERHAPTPEELEAARKRQEERKARRLFEDWKERALSALSRGIGVGWEALQDGPPWSEAQYVAIQWGAYWDYLSGILNDGDEQEQMEILGDWPSIGARLEKALSKEAA